jgi:hypothetical protein
MLIKKETNMSLKPMRALTLALFLSLSLAPYRASLAQEPTQTKVPTLGDVLDQTPPPPQEPVAPQQNFQNPQPGMLPPQNMMQQQPVPLAGASMLDINSAVLGKLDIDLTDGHFNNSDVDKLHLTALNLNMKDGAIKGLNIDVKGGRFQEMAFDQLTIAAQGDMAFDRDLLLNEKVLQFKSPAAAQVYAVVSQDSLNRFISSPQTLEKLSSTASRKVSMLASMLGGNAANFGFTLSEASVVLAKSNRVVINMKTSLGLGSMGVPLPLSLDTKLGLKDGWINLSDTHLNTNGTEISPLLSEMLVKKINGVSDWGLKTDDIHFEFSDLKVVPNKQFILKGTAQINRLRFGKEKAG